jgi:hypothetical protein
LQTSIPENARGFFAVPLAHGFIQMPRQRFHNTKLLSVVFELCVLQQSCPVLSVPYANVFFGKHFQYRPVSSALKICSDMKPKFSINFWNSFLNSSAASSLQQNFSPWTVICLIPCLGLNLVKQLDDALKPPCNFSSSKKYFA